MNLLYNSVGIEEMQAIEDTLSFITMDVNVCFCKILTKIAVKKYPWNANEVSVREIFLPRWKMRETPNFK